MFINPEQTLIHLELKPGYIVADFGCGAGHYSMAAARLIGANGKVFSFDVQKEALDALRSHAKTVGLQTIETILVNLEKPNGSKLKDASVDAVIIASMLFQSDDKPAVIKEAVRILKPGGKIMIIEWNQEKGIGGPPLAMRLTREEIKRLLEAAGIPMEKEFNAGDMHFGFLFKKS
jgi:ubiquinone/menaquinone biosynthesis C-methylase UbiE